MAALSLWRCGLVAMAAAVLPVVPGLAQVPEGASLGTQEAHPTRVLPQASPHWV